jgi:hypothetical protein
MNRIALLAFAAGLLALFLPWAPAEAQATRTWVSGVGDDANPCSRTAPCKTFAGAISKTAAGGEINCLDPGGFGALTITKSISLLCGASGESGVLVSGTNGITVAAGATDVVVLQGLDFEGLANPIGSGGSAGLNGINFISGLVLHVDKCVVRGFAQWGINGASSTASSKLDVTNSFIVDNGTTSGNVGGGIQINPSASMTVSINNTYVANNILGISFNNPTGGATVKGTVKNSSATGNTLAGIIANGAGNALNVMIDDSVFSNNGTNGVAAAGSPAVIEIGRSTVSGNATGFKPIASGLINTYSNNEVDGNGTNGSISGTANQL